MIAKNCLNCGAGFSVYPSLNRIKYCSHKCYGVAKVGTVRSEADKRKISATMKRKGLRGPVLRGAACHFWRGGRSKFKSLRWQLMNTPEYKQWRKDILERDDYTCQFCGTKGGRLNVDHHPFTHYQIVKLFAGIKTVADLLKIEFLFDRENGRTLCEPCHQQYHKQAGGRYGYQTT